MFQEKNKTYLAIEGVVGFSVEKSLAVEPRLVAEIDHRAVSSKDAIAPLRADL